MKRYAKSRHFPHPADVGRIVLTRLVPSIMLMFLGASPAAALAAQHWNVQMRSTVNVDSAYSQNHAGDGQVISNAASNFYTNLLSDPTINPHGQFDSVIHAHAETTDTIQANPSFAEGDNVTEFKSTLNVPGSVHFSYNSQSSGSVDSGSDSSGQAPHPFRWPTATVGGGLNITNYVPFFTFDDRKFVFDLDPHQNASIAVNIYYYCVQTDVYCQVDLVSQFFLGTGDGWQSPILYWPRNTDLYVSVAINNAAPSGRYPYPYQSPVHFGYDRTSGMFDSKAGFGLTFLDGVPEPSSWSLMILGAGLAGAALRSRRRRGLEAAG
jgi:hypothetical protein